MLKIMGFKGVMIEILNYLLSKKFQKLRRLIHYKLHALTFSHIGFDERMITQIVYLVMFHKNVRKCSKFEYIIATHTRLPSTLVPLVSWAPLRSYHL